MCRISSSGEAGQKFLLEEYFKLTRTVFHLFFNLDFMASSTAQHEWKQQLTILVTILVYAIVVLFGIIIGLMVTLHIIRRRHRRRLDSSNTCRGKLSYLLATIYSKLVAIILCLWKLFFPMTESN